VESEEHILRGEAQDLPYLVALQKVYRQSTRFEELLLGRELKSAYKSLARGGEQSGLLKNYSTLKVVWGLEGIKTHHLIGEAEGTLVLSAMEIGSGEKVTGMNRAGLQCKKCPTVLDRLLIAANLYTHFSEGFTRDRAIGEVRDRRLQDLACLSRAAALSQ
jgi:hypothetical protein